jgi:hypothetical protein
MIWAEMPPRNHEETKINVVAMNLSKTFNTETAETAAQLMCSASCANSALIVYR